MLKSGPFRGGGILSPDWEDSAMLGAGDVVQVFDRSVHTPWFDLGKKHV